jgi:molybdopterin synthase catalytic subunit
MNVKVRLFAGLHDLLGEREVSLDLADGATVAELRRELERRYPIVTPYLPTLICAVDEEYVDPEHRLKDGDDVAIIPPVSGGGDVLGPFEVTPAPLDPARLVAAVRKDESGAVVLFHGVARNNADGRRVVALEYDAYPAMAEKKLREVADEVAARWRITGIGIFHRTGRLAIGEASLLVAVSSAHRQEAFEACHHAVDRIKQTVPIWKKEIWEDGDGAWVAGHAVEPSQRAPSGRA